MVGERGARMTAMVRHQERLKETMLRLLRSAGLSAQDEQTEAFLRAVDALPTPKRAARRAVWAERVVKAGVLGFFIGLVMWWWDPWGIGVALASAGVGWVAFKWRQSLEQHDKMRELAAEMRRRA